MSILGDWTDAVALELGLEPGLDRTLLLDLARDAAHGVARPAAPLTTYLLGLAVGRGADPVEAAGRLSALAAQWQQEQDTQPADPQPADPQPAAARPVDPATSPSA